MSGGYQRLKNISRVSKTISRKDREQCAYNRVLMKLPEIERIDLLETWEKTKETGEKEMGDGIILTLMARGFSRIEICALLGVGESRLHRLSKYTGENRNNN